MSAGFIITGGKGFRITFENGWAVSVQFGPGNYCENHDERISVESQLQCGAQGSMTAEVAVIHPTEGLIELPGGDTVLGYQTPKEVLELLIKTAMRGPAQ